MASSSEIPVEATDKSLPLLAEEQAPAVDGAALDGLDVIDVREIPHARRHPTIFARFDRLAPGEAFTLVNNHDPRPLLGQFEFAHPGAFTWDYVESGPQVWRIRIGRPAEQGS